MTNIRMYMCTRTINKGDKCPLKSYDLSHILMHYSLEHCTLQHNRLIVYCIISFYQECNYCIFLNTSHPQIVPMGKCGLVPTGSIPGHTCMVCPHMYIHCNTGFKPEIHPSMVRGGQHWKVNIYIARPVLIV